jgi:hypothetical protein
MRGQGAKKHASAARHSKRKPRPSLQSTASDKPGHAAELPALYHAEALDALREGFRLAYGRRGRTAAQADIVFGRLAANLRVLKQFHALSRQVLAGDADARAEFRANLEDLARRYPSLLGSAERLRKRAGVTGAPGGGAGPGPGVARARGGRPGDALAGMSARTRCGMLSSAGMLPVYVGAAAAYGHEGAGLPQALDVIAGLSRGHGRFEALAHAFDRDGIDGIDRAIEWGEATGDPTFGSPDPDGVPGHGRGGKPGLGDPEPDLTGHGTDSFPIHVPPGDLTPPTDPCELVREACEGLLIDTITNGASDMPAGARPARPGARADNIDRVDLLDGRCAGQRIVVRGHDFGALSTVLIGGRQVPTRALVMMVGGECTRVDVEPAKWHDNRIEATLPENVTSGPVGIYDPSAIELHNRWSSRANRAAQDVIVASKCLGTPMKFPSSGPAAQIVAPTVGVPCPPVTDHNVIRAGRPIIGHFTALGGGESGTEILVDPSDSITLTWSVINSDSITLDRLSSDGPDFAGQPSVLNPGGSSWSLGPAAHSRATIFRYRLTATNGNGCGSVSAQVRVLASKRPGLGIDNIEVTHGIQTPANTVPLVKGKPTVVRVYASHARDGFVVTGAPDERTDVVPSVGGRLRVRREGEQSWSVWLDPINASTETPPSITLPKPVARTKTNDTLNFSIPPQLCDGTLSIEVEVSVRNFAVPPGETRGFSDRVQKRFDGFVFHPRRSLAIKFIPVTVASDLSGVVTVPTGISNPPTNSQCTRFLGETLKFLPTSAVSISRHEYLSVTLRADSVTIPLPGGGPPLVEAVGYDISGNVILRLLALLHQQVDDTSIWAILVPAVPTASGIGWGIWGQAASIPGDVYMTPIGTAQANEAGGAHELAHCLNQEHISLQCGGGLTASGGDTPEDWGENGGILADVPFDVTRNATVTGTVSELMTYCPPKWASPQRWQRVFDYLGEDTE